MIGPLASSFFAASQPLTTAGAIAGTSAGVGTASSTLKGTGKLSGTAAGVGSAAATGIAFGFIDGTAAGVGSASGTIFSPLSLSGLVLWLRADLGVTLNGGNVSDWADQSGNGEDFSAVTDEQPLFVASAINGKPGVDFSDSDRLFNTGMTQATSDYTFYFIHSSDTAEQFQNLWDVQTTRLLFEQRAGTSGTSYHNGAARFTFGAANTGDEKLAYVLKSGGTSAILRRNESQLGSAIAYATRPMGGNVAIGNAHNGLTGAFRGPISEVIIYDVAHTSTEWDQIEAYLKARYAV